MTTNASKDSLIVLESENKCTKTGIKYPINVDKTKKIEFSASVIAISFCVLNDKKSFLNFLIPFLNKNKNIKL